MFAAGTMICRRFRVEITRNPSITGISKVDPIPLHFTHLWDRDYVQSVKSRKRTKVLLFCNKLTSIEVCITCRENPSASIYALSARSHLSEARYLQLEAICSDCCGIPFGEEVCCDSQDCPVFYSRLKAASRLETSLTKNSRLSRSLSNDMNDW